MAGEKKNIQLCQARGALVQARDGRSYEQEKERARAGAGAGK